MNLKAKNLPGNPPKTLRIVLLCLAVMFTLSAFACKKTGKSESLDILGPSDETAEAAQLVAEANQNLTKIKVLFQESDGKLEELKKAMKENNAEQVRKISNEVIDLINSGSGLGKEAIEKIKQAQGMNINTDYGEYLSLKEDSLTRQLEAFSNYHSAARSLRENYDPKNKLLKEKINAEFKNYSENYRILMEKARDSSKRANKFAKEAQKAKSSS